MTSRYPDRGAWPMRRSLGLLCGIAVLATAAVAAPTFVLPPLVQPASTEHHPGKVIWADLVTPDIAGAKHFYGELFGWTFNDVHTGASDYSVALVTRTKLSQCGWRLAASAGNAFKLARA